MTSVPYAKSILSYCLMTVKPDLVLGQFVFCDLMPPMTAAESIIDLTIQILPASIRWLAANKIVTRYIGYHRDCPRIITTLE